MRKSFRRILLPVLVQMGFNGKSSDFQRRRDSLLDLLSIQYWKYGGEFILEFASCPCGDLQTSWGEIVPEAKLGVIYINPGQRARLEERGSSMGAHMRGFSFSGFGEEMVRYDALAARVAGLLPQIDTWLKSGAAGEHIHAWQ